MPIVAMNTTVQLSAEVENTTDTAVIWKLGGAPGAFYNPGFRNVGGTVTADGHWTPDNSWGFHAMTVVSNADPLEYAEGAVWVVNGDADADTQFDAMDLGAVALSWGLERLGQREPRHRRRRIRRQPRRRRDRRSLQERLRRAVRCK